MVIKWLNITIICPPSISFSVLLLRSLSRPAFTHCSPPPSVSFTPCVWLEARLSRLTRMVIFSLLYGCVFGFFSSHLGHNLFFLHISETINCNKKLIHYILSSRSTLNRSRSLSIIYLYTDSGVKLGCTYIFKKIYTILILRMLGNIEPSKTLIR